MRVFYGCFDAKSTAIRIQMFVLFFAITVLLGASAAGAKPWPIKQFKVVLAEPPEDDKMAPTDYLVPVPGTEAAVIAGLAEGFLAEIARQYERDFRPPRLPVIKDTGVKKYAVFMYDYGDVRVGGRLFNFACSGEGREQWIQINRQRATVWATTEERGLHVKSDYGELYRALAHELFHAIQGTYDNIFHSIRFDCKERSWLENLIHEPENQSPGYHTVVEGGADGAAVYLAAKRDPDLLSSADHPKILGSFFYRRNLFKASKNESYYTSSFWRYLIERYGMAFMDYLLRQPISSKNPTWKDRVVWLDGALQTYDPEKKEHLYTVLPQAITEIASYSPQRYRGMSWLDWRSSLFAEREKIEKGDGEVTLKFTEAACQGSVLSKEAYMNLTSVEPKTQEMTLRKIDPLGALCVNIRWTPQKDAVDLKIEAIAGSKKVADQLHLAMAALGNSGDPAEAHNPDKWDYCWDWRAQGGGEAGMDSCLYEKIKLQSGPSPEKFAKSWITDQDFHERGVFGKHGSALLIVANVHSTPQLTNPAQGVIFRVGFDKTRSKGKELLPASTSTKSTFATSNTMGMLYGITKKNPTWQKGMPAMTLETRPRAGDSPGASQKSYVLAPDPMQEIRAGYTGPLRAIVAMYDPENEDTAMITSMACDVSEAHPIGTVLRADEQELRVHVMTDLCRMDPMKGPPYPVVDHLDAEIILPFGWRYLAETAPSDLVTEGVRIYMDRYQDRMAGVPDFQSIMEMVGAGSRTGGGGGSGGGGAGGPGTDGGGNPAGSEGFSGCDCSCEALVELQEECQSLDGSDMAAAMMCASCMSECVQAMMNCGL